MLNANALAEAGLLMFAGKSFCKGERLREFRSER
jgi:hypothetical protein